MAPGVTLDREHTSSYDATVTATDRSNASDSITVTINVSNVNEAPTAVNDTAMTDEDQSVKSTCSPTTRTPIRRRPT